MKDLYWKKIAEGRGGSSIPNLYVLVANGREVGMVDKPHDTDGCVNSWRCYLGIGENAAFLGHRESKYSAMQKVQERFGQPGHKIEIRGSK